MLDINKAVNAFIVKIQKTVKAQNSTSYKKKTETALEDCCDDEILIRAFDEDVENDQDMIES